MFQVRLVGAATAAAVPPQSSLPSSSSSSSSDAMNVEEGTGAPVRAVYEAGVTHGGVREFSAEEGYVGLPEKVLVCLGLAQASSEQLLKCAIQVKYLRLPKVVYVKFQPVLNKFFNLGPVKQVLEQNLRFHTTLTLGDQVTVWYRGESYDLRVTDMKPEPRGTLVDTDVEVDLDLSDEYLKSQEYRDTQEKQKENLKEKSVATTGRGYVLGGSLSQADGRASSGTTESFPAPAPAPVPAPVSVSGETTAQIQTPVAPVVQLPPPPGDVVPRDSVINCKVKTKSRALARRFHLDDSFAHLFNFVKNETGPLEGRLVLSTRFPPRELVEHSPELSSGATFRQLGFSGQELFHLSTR